MAGRRGVGKIAGAAAKGLMKPLEHVVKEGEKLVDVVETVVKDSKGRVIPPGVKRLPSGRLPGNFEHAGKQFPMDRLPPAIREKYPNGVHFTQDGFPDFGPYATHTVKFDPPGFQGNHGSDFTDAFRMAGNSPNRDYTWHHHQDGTTMQYVPTDLHNAVRHAGGVAIARGRH
jgi:hypothetical protein